MGRYIRYSFFFIHLSLIPATIIFDMNGVLSYQNKIKTCYLAGPVHIARYVLRHKTVGIRSLFHQALNKTPYVLNDPTIIPPDETGKPLPDIMIALMRGDLDGYALVDRVEEFLKTTDDYSLQEKELLNSLIRAVFLPGYFAQATCFYDEAIKLVHDCRACGHTCYVLSNWDNCSFEFIRQAYPSFCTLFEDLIISGELGMIKPDPAIYQYVLNKYGLNPAATAFIDDQRINIRPARNSGMFAIHCPQTNGHLFKKPDISRVRAKLDAWFHSINEPCLCRQSSC